MSTVFGGIIHTHRLSVVVTLFIAVSLSSPMSSQSTTRGLTVMTDSVAIQVVAQGAIQELAAQIAEGGLAAGARPWRIVIRDSMVPAWQAVRSGLFTILHGRPATPADGAAETLIFGLMGLKGDSLFGAVTIGSTRWCGVRWATSGTTKTIVSVQRDGRWQPGVATNVRYADDFCKVRW